jgi:hypothetical protein
MRDDPDPSTNRKAQETPTRVEECRVANFSGDGVHVTAVPIKARVILYHNLLNCVISNNVLHQGALKTLISGSGGSGVIINDNPGSLLLT